MIDASPVPQEAWESDFWKTIFKTFCTKPNWPLIAHNSQCQSSTSAILHSRLRNKAAGHCTLRSPPKLLKVKGELLKPRKESSISKQSHPPTLPRLPSWPRNHWIVSWKYLGISGLSSSFLPPSAGVASIACWEGISAVALSLKSRAAYLLSKCCASLPHSPGVCNEQATSRAMFSLRWVLSILLSPSNWF